MAWDPTVPATSAALLSAPIRENFAALDALMAAGPATPYPLTTLGDLFVGGASGVPGRLGIGTTGQRLTVVAGVPAWQTAAAAAPAYPLLAPDGVVGAPSYSFANDPDTGWFWPGAGFLGAALNGAERVRLSAVSGGGAVTIMSTGGSPFVQAGATVTTPDVMLFRDAAGILAQRNVGAAQTFRLYNTFTDAANGEWLEFNWGSNIARLLTRANGTGTPQSLAIRLAGDAGPAMTIGGAVNGGVVFANGTATTANVAGRVAVGGGGGNLSISGQSMTLRVVEAFQPTATSTMVAVPLELKPTINYSNATPGAGSYEALKIAVTETALPTGQSYMIRASGGAAGTTDVFAVTNTGQVRGAAGGVNTGQPTYSFAGDAATGLFLAAAQTLGFAMGSAERARLATVSGGATLTILAATNAALAFGTIAAPDVLLGRAAAGILTLRGAAAAGAAVNMVGIATPTTPAAGQGLLYMKADKKMYFLNDAGVETALW